MFNSFDIWAPGHRDSVENTAFGAYVHRCQKIEDLISLLSICDDPNDIENQIIIADHLNINLDSLSEEEIEHIEKEVSKHFF